MHTIARLPDEQALLFEGKKHHRSCKLEQMHSISFPLAPMQWTNYCFLQNAGDHQLLQMNHSTT